MREGQGREQIKEEIKYSIKTKNAKKNV